MTSRTVMNWVLLGGVLVLALVVYFLPAQRREQPRSALTRVTPGQVTHVDITRSGKTDIVLVKADSHWRLVKPIQARANRFRMDSLLGITAADSYARFGAGGRDLSEFKLDKPLAQLRLDGLRVKFGGSEPLQGRRYVQIGDTVYLIDDYFYQDVISPVADFVSPSLLPADSDPVKLVLPGFVVQRDQEGHWTLAGGDRHKTDGLDDFVERWRQARALEVKPYAGATRRDTVTVSFAKGHPPVAFEIVARKPELVLARPDIGMAYHFTQSQAEGLLHLPSPGGKAGGPKPGAP